ncbi:MAG TPA: FxLYD domain-containing protein [Bryobacteraceae bacterium]|nr:FxLYD domain-containing protein [Bryobacteraceae bacterium]
MAGSIRKLFASLKNPGVTPTGKPAPSLWDRLLAGPTPSDPLYLSNRTWKQKLRLGLVVMVPVLVVVAVAAYAMLTPPTLTDTPPETLTPAQVAARTPVLPKGFTLPQNTDLQIMEVTVDRTGGMFVAGTLKNNASRRVAGAELVFDLADQDGSQVGSASTRVESVEPNGTLHFRFPIPHKNAAFVLVRELRPSF